jgi:hypothetical protein
MISLYQTSKFFFTAPSDFGGSIDQIQRVLDKGQWVGGRDFLIWGYDYKKVMDLTQRSRLQVLLITGHEQPE